MRAVFEAGANLGLVEGEKMQECEKSLGPELEANLPCCRWLRITCSNNIYEYSCLKIILNDEYKF